MVHMLLNTWVISDCYLANPGFVFKDIRTGAVFPFSGQTEDYVFTDVSLSSWCFPAWLSSSSSPSSCNGIHAASARKTWGRCRWLGWVVRRSSHHFRQETLPSTPANEWRRLWGISSNCYDYNKRNEITVTSSFPFVLQSYPFFVQLFFSRANASVTLTSNLSPLNSTCRPFSFISFYSWLFLTKCISSGKSSQFLDTRTAWRDSYPWP